MLPLALLANVLKRSARSSGFTSALSVLADIDVGGFGSRLRAVVLAGALLPVSTSIEASEPPTSEELRELGVQARLLLSDRCAACHGPDAASREAELRLDQKDGVFREALNGGRERVVAPGAPEASELLRRITTDSSYERMPPPESELTLTDAEIDLLRRWVEAGAPWQEHWSFTPIDLQAAPPTVAFEELAAHEIVAQQSLRNGVDAFVLRQLIDEGLKPNPPADRHSLIRRLTFDLTGLPPTPAEIDAFVNDNSADAYVRVVDRLLASPRFGERMAAPWLDAARYADTYGYQADVYREMWPWRDWVIEAFNDGMPYDRFLTWQIAGDLIPDATRRSRLATAFNRNHRQTNEGGSIEEEFHAEYVSDRVNTLGTAVLGLTLECARCHDHKYDPVSQKDYYQLFAFFNNIDEFGLYSHFTDAVPTPTLRLPSTAEAERLEAASRAVEAAEQRLAETLSGHRARFSEWRKTQTASQPQAEISDRLAHYSFEKIEDGKVASEAAGADEGTWRGELEATGGPAGQAIVLSGDDHFETSVGGDFTRDDPFTIAAWLRADRHHDRAVLWHRSRAWTDAGSRGYELLLEDGRLSAGLIHFWPGNAVRVKAIERLPVERWTHVVVAHDGSGRAAGLSLYVDGRKVQTETVRDGLDKTINGGGADKFAIGARFRDRGFTGGMVDELQIFSRHLSPIEIRALPGETAFAQTISDALADGSPESLADVAAYHASAIDPVIREARASLTEARKTRSEIEDGIREIMVMEEMPTPRETFVLKRGAYDAPGQEVAPDVPDSLPSMREEWPRNRLGLARWLTDPQNPLVARVAVNRLWQQLFGTGLTATPEDFGRQGEPPTHPELLDWLAAQLIQDGWDLKQTIRRIVLSGTYRQSAVPSAEAQRVDPANELLSHAPSRRLSMEMIRDASLLAGGLLAEYQGGPPVKPYQPPGLWKEKSNGAEYQRDIGVGSHRRSLYTFWKRTSPPPSMLIFDVPNREVCVARRRPTQTPLQALVLLNDEQYVEAARGCAARVLDELGCEDVVAPSDASRLVERLCLYLIGRPPSEREARILAEVLHQQRANFAADPAATERFLKIGDLSIDPPAAPEDWAAVTIVAQTLMNYAPSLRQP